MTCALPCRVKEREGAVPLAVTSTGPERGTGVLGIVMGTSSGMSPCGAVTVAVPFREPSTVFAPTRAAQRVMASFTVVTPFRADFGLVVPTGIVSGMSVWSRMVKGTLPIPVKAQL